ncbi:MAG: hypothetical protein Q7S28_01815 [bacterium]|nr:hypothetical protein [bacterium]
MTFFKWIFRIKFWIKIATTAAIIIIATVVLNLTLYNPAVSFRAYRWLESHRVIGAYTSIKKFLHIKDGVFYPMVSADKFHQSSFLEARAALVGAVGESVETPNGDMRLVLTDPDNNNFVAVILKEHPVPLPPKKTYIKIWGITHYDLNSRTWELHPVLGWEKQP